MCSNACKLGLSIIALQGELRDNWVYSGVEIAPARRRELSSGCGDKLLGVDLCGPAGLGVYMMRGGGEREGRGARGEEARCI